MEFNDIDDAIALLEKANANLEPELLDAVATRQMLTRYARVKKLAAYGETALAGKVGDAAVLATVTGTSIGKAKSTVEAGKALRTADTVAHAFSVGDLSLDQATEIARAENAQPGTAADLMTVAKEQSFQVLREQSRKVVLEAEQKRGLAERQREARSARVRSDELGMVNIHLCVQPHVGTPIVNRAETIAGRLYRKAKSEGKQVPFERHLADAYALMLNSNDAKPGRRPELVVLVSQEVADRGWKDVREGEVCKIPGVGPVAPEDAKEIARNAFISAVVCDGTDLRQLKRWTRSIPVEVLIALELGKPPDFDGIACVTCGNRFRNQKDHVEPYAAGGPTSLENIEPECWSCHQAKTERDRAAGKLVRPPDGPPSAREDLAPGEAAAERGPPEGERETGEAAAERGPPEDDT